MDLSFIAVVLLSTLAAGGVTYALFYPMLSGEARAEKRRKEFAAPVAARAFDREAQVRAKRGQIAQSLKEIESRENARNKLTLEQKIQQAGLNWNRKKYYIVSALTSVGTGLVLFMLSGNPVLGLVGLFIGGFGLPPWFLQRCRNNRLKKFGIEFPNAIDVITRGIKAGLPLNDCLRIIASEAAEPVRTEFRLIIESQALGLPLTEAVAKLYERMPAPNRTSSASCWRFSKRLAAISPRPWATFRKSSASGARCATRSGRLDGSQGLGRDHRLSAAVRRRAGLPNDASLHRAALATQAGKFALVGCAIWMLIGILVMRKMINFDI